MYIPIIAIIGMSFNATPYGMFPYVFTFDWYKILFTESNLLPACVFSLKFAFGVTVAAIIIGTMASFGLQAYSPKWSNRLNALIQLPIIIPWLVTAISLLLLFSFIGAGRSMVSMFFGNLIVVLPYVVRWSMAVLCPWTAHRNLPHGCWAPDLSACSLTSRCPPSSPASWPAVSWR